MKYKYYAEDYFSLLNLASQPDLGKKTPGDLFMGGGTVQYSTVKYSTV